MERNNYQIYHDDIKDRDSSTYISVKNEPWFVNGDIGWYPDMDKAYESFSKEFDISRYNFILTNGCENALRIALIYIMLNSKGDKSFAMEDPGWQLAEVIAQSFGYNINKYAYKFDESSNMFIPDDNHVYSTAFYLTDRYNNLFEHKSPIPRGDFIIQDETYSFSSLIHGITPESNKLIIGSFSKFGGPGLRLGYIIFNEKINKAIQMLREQYICTAACNYINQHNIKKHLVDILSKKEKKKGKIVSIHPVYMTIKDQQIDLPHKHFKIGDNDFYRIGRVKDELF